MSTTTSPEHLDKHLVSLTSPFSFVAEQYQGLRMKLEHLRRTEDVRVIAVTSAGAGDGKTLTSINLAGALVRDSDLRVVLIDADLRRSAIAKHFGIPGHDTPGLAELVINSQTTISDVTWNIDPFNFAVIPAGSTREPVHAILRSPRLEAVLREAREQYDYVILDTPPLAPVFDSALLSRLVDGLLLVVAADKTPRRMFEDALNQLDGSKVLGLVFNGDSRRRFGHYMGYSGKYFSGSAGKNT